MIDHCSNLQLEIQGNASDEGSPERNRELSQLRADRVRLWLIDKGVNPSKISAAVGFDTSTNAVQELTKGITQTRLKNGKIRSTLI